MDSQKRRQIARTVVLAPVLAAVIFVSLSNSRLSRDEAMTVLALYCGLVILYVVRLFNRADDPRQAKRPPDPP